MSKRYTVVVNHTEIYQVVVELPDGIDADLVLKTEAENFVAPYDDSFKHKGRMISRQLFSADTRTIGIMPTEDKP